MRLGRGDRMNAVSHRRRAQVGSIVDRAGAVTCQGRSCTARKGSSVPYFDLSPAELEAYVPQINEPTDFDAFWAITLEESHPGARIVLPANEAAALAALDEHPQITLAVMSMSPEAAQASALGSALAARQARVVLMGFEAEERGESAGFAVLHRPFRTVDLLAMLANPAR